MEYTKVYDVFAEAIAAGKVVKKTVNMKVGELGDKPFESLEFTEALTFDDVIAIIGKDKVRDAALAVFNANAKQNAYQQYKAVADGPAKAQAGIKKLLETLKSMPQFADLSDEEILREVTRS